MTERDANQAASPGVPGDPTPTQTDWRPASPGPAAHLEEAAPATGAVAVPVSRASGGGATRWGIALVVVALVIGLAAAAVFLVSGSSTPSTLLAYAPKDAVAWTEVRMDLPGDQARNLGSFLQKFPGFADQSTMEAKLDEALDRIVKAATRDAQDYSTKIKPWFGGEIGMAVPKLPDPAALGGSGTPDGSALALVSVSDATKARAWFDEVVKDEPHTSASYNGVDLVTVGAGKTGVMGIVDGKVMLLGDEASVKAAIDSKGQGGLATNDRFKAAQAATTGDAVLTYYADGKAYLEWAARAAAGTGASQSASGLLDTYAKRIPDWFAGRVRIEGDALRLEQVNPHLDVGPKRENRTSNLVGHLPASTIVALDAHDLGATVLDAVDMARTAPGTADAFKQIDQVVALVGGWDGLLTWMGDTGIVVTRDGTKVGGGLVAATTDKAASQQVVTTLKGFLALGGGSMGVTMRDEPYNGTSIAVLSFQGGSGTLPTGTVPEIGIAATDDLVVVGADLDFVKGVIDAKAGSSLADDARYKAMLERVGTKNVSSVWFDAAAIRGLLEQIGKEQSASDMATYESDVKPYVEPFDAIAGASVIDGGVDRMTLVLTVK